jgi:hypothetical protein
VHCGFAPKSYFRSIHSIDARFPSGRAASGDYDMTGQESELHEPSSHIFGEVEAIDDARFSFFEFGECPG